MDTETMRQLHQGDVFSLITNPKIKSVIKDHLLMKRLMELSKKIYAEEKKRAGP